MDLNPPKFHLQSCLADVGDIGLTVLVALDFSREKNPKSPGAQIIGNGIWALIPHYLS